MCCGIIVFFFKQKTAYEMRISDWSSDVCSSDLFAERPHRQRQVLLRGDAADMDRHRRVAVRAPGLAQGFVAECRVALARVDRARQQFHVLEAALAEEVAQLARRRQGGVGAVVEVAHPPQGSDERRVGKEWVSPWRS